MICSRRFFLGGASAFAASSFAGGKGPSAPFRIGMMTDTHVMADNGLLENVRLAYRLFKSKGVDVVLNCGDIADKYSLDAYRGYRATVDQVYADAVMRPDEIFVWANHDRRPFSEKGFPKNDYAASFAFAKPVLGIKHGMYHAFRRAGYTFLVFPQNRSQARFEKEILSALKDSPGRPVIVFDHVPPVGTTFESNRSGDKGSAAFLRKHPEVVVFSGHTHNTLYNPECIWQDGFTCVNLGCLSKWGGGFTGRNPQVKQIKTAAIVEFYENRMVVRRFSIVTGEEIEPENPWQVEWGSPFVRAEPVVPSFPRGAEIEVSFKNGMSVSWPAAAPRMAVLGYRMDLFRRQGDGRISVSRRETCGDFWKAQDGSPAQQVFSDAVPEPFFAEGGEYELELRPMGFGGKCGEPVRWTGKVPSVRQVATLVNGTGGLKVVKGSVREPGEEELCADADGWFPLVGSPWILVPAPHDHVDREVKRRLVIDIEFEQGSSSSYMVEPRLTYSGGWICGGCASPSGRSSLRYVFDFNLKPSPYRLSVSLNRGLDGGRFRILRFRLESPE